ncbi:MAG: cytochrome P450 [Bacteriovoracales bacterium]
MKKFKDGVINYLHYKKSPIGFFSKQVQEKGDDFVFPILGFDYYFISSPLGVRQALIDNYKSFVKGRTYAKSKEILGEALAVLDGEKWQKQNHSLKSLFSQQYYSSISEFIRKEIEKEIHSWESESGKEINLEARLFRTIFNLNLDLVMGGEGRIDRPFSMEELNVLFEFIIYKSRSIVPFHNYLPTRKGRDFKLTLQKFNRFVQDEIRLARPSKDYPSYLNFLSKNKQLSSNELFNMVKQIILVGQETTSTAIMWTMILLARNPSYWKKLRREAHEMSSADFSLINLEELLAVQVIFESMRLYPPVWAFTRRAEKNVSLAGLEVKKNANVVLGCYFTHRNPGIWERPNDFIPERFKEKKKSYGINFFPFGAGPRGCIGKKTSLLISIHFIYSFVKKFEFAYPENFKENIIFDARHTLVPVNGKKIILKSI